jgi:hypothetical protein
MVLQVMLRYLVDFRFSLDRFGLNVRCSGVIPVRPSARRSLPDLQVESALVDVNQHPLSFFSTSRILASCGPGCTVFQRVGVTPLPGT